ncbi:uncharacterized protein N7518_008719 [Penicillium psychrosexuale]|uniref:uncharacterized protein n=1 Tax=Penicillium psychrosexuale TaxID=1002107 RepID=UPI002545A039|nr:uncharacterized protein N7518_008719 [Penicillium psychrosexuale]KAJ5791708.1 hypothetical protein N7518_008719 [Penicillium psychrosexuale]
MLGECCVRVAQVDFVNGGTRAMEEVRQDWRAVGVPSLRGWDEARVNEDAESGYSMTGLLEMECARFARSKL